MGMAEIGGQAGSAQAPSPVAWQESVLGVGEQPEHAKHS
jgi:hypothetical protein